ncbi:hypothetical protein KUCAC02_021773 [Chaenocephalus aceratus]|uniref:Uncharacterized protein n=1 Tax=Chaenocephalus aceratus TaxID=36190 RepID=A0ACB9XGH5_CHAAC|nr:hypothetical protein KUCAC02_021773 [Chaenocephalus aceratus]
MLLKSLDEPEDSLDSDGDGVRPAGSPSTPRSDPDPIPTTHKDPSTTKQSGENSDAEEETEEDTIELELALERKKVKKNRWKTAFPSLPSPESDSRGSDLQDNAETALPMVLESVAEGEDKDIDSSEEKTVAKPPAKEEVETPELKFQIGELANTLTSKMEFLGINKKAISNFQFLLLQTETRIADWREGALNGIYLRRRLQEAAEHIKYYELNATPKGWSCHWDREHRRYFYVNDRTNASQWDFPKKEDKEEDLKDTQTSSQGDSNTSSASAGGVTGQSITTPASPKTCKLTNMFLFYMRVS